MKDTSVTPKTQPLSSTQRGAFKDFWHRFSSRFWKFTDQISKTSTTSFKDWF